MIRSGLGERWGRTLGVVAAILFAGAHGCSRAYTIEPASDLAKTGQGSRRGHFFLVERRGRAERPFDCYSQDEKGGWTPECHQIELKRAAELKVVEPEDTGVEAWTPAPRPPRTRRPSPQVEDTGMRTPVP